MAFLEHEFMNTCFEGASCANSSCNYFYLTHVHGLQSVDALVFIASDTYKVRTYSSSFVASSGLKVLVKAPDLLFLLALGLLAL